MQLAIVADHKFIFTIFFLTLGPVKIIAPFARLTHEATPKYRRDVAILASVIATAVVLLVALLGHRLVVKYQLSLDALRLAGGLVLLLSALFNTFPHLQPPLEVPKTQPTALQLAINPIVSPIVIPPVGVAAILIFTTLFQENFWMHLSIIASLLSVMFLDFLAMLFADKIIKVPGLMQVLNLTAVVLTFVQVALAIQVILIVLKNLGIAR
ncbi:MarC family protein [Kamptonema formosum]|uniref:MarC family protein n=1 Tax=Kamptonema formosum TaxID=331992 RepID=UPI00034AB2BA|nr:MarC family protein [Oscillatoria sp. PCC 10802]